MTKQPERLLFGHLANPTDTGITVTCMDGPDPNAGGACHEYMIYADGVWVDGTQRDAIPVGGIRFQHGPVKVHGRNGITEVSLLAVLKDRFEHFQRGPFACDANAETLAAINAALDAQHKRTRERESRNVEGTNTK